MKQSHICRHFGSNIMAKLSAGSEVSLIRQAERVTIFYIQYSIFWILRSHIQPASPGSLLSVTSFKLFSPLSFFTAELAETI
jgi:hypothetical protein